MRGAFEAANIVKVMCFKVIQLEDKDACTEILHQLERFIGDSQNDLCQEFQQLMFPTIFTKLRPQHNRRECTDNVKISVINVLSTLLNKSKVKKKAIFFNLLGLLLEEVYDLKSAKVKPTCEEYKLAVMKCCTSLFESIDWDILFDIYSMENVGKLAPIIYVSLEFTKNERLTTLRIACIQCIMALAKVSDIDDLTDTVLRMSITDVLICYIPGIASGLTKICVDDKNAAYALTSITIKAWGRLMVLLTQDYEPHDQLVDILEELDMTAVKINEPEKFTSKENVQDYVNSMKRNSKWYKEHDEKLQHVAKTLMQLTAFDNPIVRLELASTSKYFIENCLRNLPKTTSKFINILIALSEDEFSKVKELSANCLLKLSKQFAENDFKISIVYSNLERDFYDIVTSLPSVFNGLDEREHLIALNLLAGYLKLFGKHKLKSILFTQANLNRLLMSLVHVAKLEVPQMNVLHQYMFADINELAEETRTPWKVFTFRSEAVQKQLEQVCSLLGREDVCDISLNYLLELYVNEPENRKEATLLINEILAGQKRNTTYADTVMDVIGTYLDPLYWDLPITATKSCPLGQVKNNVIQICLQLEGIGKMSLAMAKGFKSLLLKVLYHILERAGSGHGMIETAGLSAISNVSVACGYKNITELIQDNSDYFSFHVMRKLRRSIYKEDVLNVLGIVMKYSNIDILPYVSCIVDKILIECCDKYQEENLNPFLRVFNIFIKCLYKWLNVQSRVDVSPMKTKEQKEEEFEERRVARLREFNNDFSDEIMGKTAEEMWKEDMAKSQEQILQEIHEPEEDPESEPYKKPEPPLHIKLTVHILSRCLNFLPSRDRTRRLLSLEILRNGVEILYDWEDELLPIVHKIWSPLIGRFKEYDTPLMINLSFQLLTIIASLSQDFIRSRAVADVMPSIKEVMVKQAKISYLKDHGATYRYTLAYKMQTNILDNLGRLLYDLDVAEGCVISVSEMVILYLSDKQPMPLQAAALDFYRRMKIFDSDIFTKLLSSLEYESTRNTEYKKNFSKIVNNKCY